MNKLPATPPTAHPTVIAARAVDAPRAVTRRAVLKAAFWTSLGAAALAIPATVINTLWPRQVEAFGGPVVVSPSLVPEPGDPPTPNFDGHFLLVNLAPDEGRIAGDEAAAAGGVLALWWKCPHLGCTVPWAEQYTHNDGTGRRGWFRCPCHGSTYTKAGVRVYGPAPRSMDTMLIEVDDRGNLVVQTGDRLPGGIDNPQRALPWPTDSPQAS